MKYIKLTVLCRKIIVESAQSEFTIIPHFGFENARTCLKINDNKNFELLSKKFVPHAGIGLDCMFKNGNSGFAAFFTSSTVVAFGFSNPKKGFNNYSSSLSSTQLQIQGGYHFKSNISCRSSSSKSKENPAKPEDKVKHEILTVRYKEQICMSCIPTAKRKHENYALG